MQRISTLDPCPSKHPQPPGYVLGSSQPRPVLAPRSYVARELLNCTVGSFYKIPHGELTQHQIKAQSAFIQQYKKYIMMSEDELHAGNLHRLLNELMGYLDDFFFFGSMTKGPNLAVTIEIHDVLTVGDARYYGWCEEAVDDDDPPRVVLRLARRITDRNLSLSELITSMSHEMVHAYLGYFRCGNAKCESYLLNHGGISGHGPTFRALEYATAKCLAEWHPRIGAFIRSSTRGTYVDEASLELEEAMCSERGEERRRLGYRGPRKNPHPNEIIKVDGLEVAIDAARLRAHVKKYAKKVSATRKSL
ncbi:hypothetical protein BJ170DRAFT_422101 [Xylariales sp. AK1849]|nr:hypothetical protein BJ170DRAFT_422101 [Xylariales sp. AK1849]